MEVLWENEFIKSPISIKKKCKSKNSGRETQMVTKSIWQPTLYKAGIVRVNDILDNEGKPLDFKNFCIKFNIQCNIITYYRVIKAIPKSWLHEIEVFINNQLQPTANNSHCLSISVNDVDTSILKTSTKVTYNCFVKMKYVEPTALSKWSSITDQYDWKNIFKLPYSCCREPYIQALQYRILHRFLPCNKWLCDISIKSVNTCDLCQGIDTIEHFIYSCNSVRNYWNAIETWWNSVSNNPVVLTEKHVIFGLYYDLPYFENVNYILLLGKKYIYNCKLNGKEINFNTFLLILKKNLEIERIICTKTKSVEMFTKKWSKVTDNLSNLFD